MNKWLPIVGAIGTLGLSAGVLLYFKGQPNSPLPTPTPTLEVAVQLTANKQPQIELKFSSDGHYVTGVNSTASITGKTTFSQKQLLGSESSGKFTYHEKIANAVMELTLRDVSGRSIFTSTYPFTVTPGSSAKL